MGYLAQQLTVVVALLGTKTRHKPTAAFVFVSTALHSCIVEIHWRITHTWHSSCFVGIHRRTVVAYLI